MKSLLILLMLVLLACSGENSVETNEKDVGFKKVLLGIPFVFHMKKTEFGMVWVEMSKTGKNIDVLKSGFDGEIDLAYDKNQVVLRINNVSAGGELTELSFVPREIYFHANTITIWDASNEIVVEVQKLKTINSVRWIQRMDSTFLYYGESVGINDGLSFDQWFILSKKGEIKFPENLHTDFVTYGVFDSHLGAFVLMKKDDHHFLKRMGMDYSFKLDTIKFKNGRMYIGSPDSVEYYILDEKQHLEIWSSTEHVATAKKIYYDESRVYN